ncbi:MAG: YegS/Rv2252/BmrU family lipid kinase [Candidatus Izemoplasmatales bacterium]
MSKAALLIINPRAGKMRGNRFLAEIISIFIDHGFDNCVYMTRHPGDGVDICKTHAKDFNLVVAIGGDGTLNEVISGMIESGVKKPLGYIPAGSTNVFSGNLGLTPDILSAAKRIMKCSSKPMDIGRFENRYFSFIASFGAFSKTSYATPQNAKNTLGHMAYIFEGIKEMPNIKPIHVRVETDTQSFEDDYIFGAFSNSLTVAGILKLDKKRVDLSDGLLEILLIKYPKNADQFSRVLSGLNTKHYDPDIISFCSTKKATVYAPKDMDWSLDGEYAAGAEIIHVETLHNAIDFIRK